MDCPITYENGARVKTSFVTSYSGGIVAQTSPDLTKAINRENDRLIKANRKELPKYDYPMNVITAAMMQRYARYGVDLKIRADDCIQVGSLDAQKQDGKVFLGPGCFCASAQRQSDGNFRTERKPSYSSLASTVRRAAYAVRKNFSAYSSLNMEPKPVTMQSISNVKAFSCDTLDAAGQQQLKNAHKRLLMIASKLPPGVEVGRLFDLHMKPLTQDVVGAQNGHTVKLPNPSEPYVAIHAHPACGNFSNGDLSNFTNNSNLKLLTAIGHNGHVYAIEKTDSYNATQAQGITDKLNIQLCKLLKSDLSNEQVLTEAEGLISESIKELQNYGIKFYE